MTKPTDTQMINELRKLGRVARDRQAADATLRAIVGSSARGGWFRRFGWQQAGALAVIVALIVPAAMDVVSGNSPLTTVRGTIDQLSDKPEQPSLTPASPSATPASYVGEPAQPVPAKEIAPETQAAPIEQAPVSAPAVKPRHPEVKTPTWLLKQTRSRVDKLYRSGSSFLGH